MHERGGYEYTSAKVAREEEGAIGNWQLRESSDNQGKRARECAEGENEEESEHMETCVVGAVVRVGSTRRPVIVARLSADQFGAEEVEWEI
jgi:hypothetical protein